MNPMLFVAVRSATGQLDPIPILSTRRPGRARGRVRPALWCLAALILFVLDLRLQPGGRHVTRLVDDVAQLSAGAGMSVAAFWRARQAQDRLRLSWLLIALGGASWAAGQAVWTYYENIASVQTPFPSAADAGYLMLPVFAMAGLLVRPSHAFSGRGRVRVGLDVLLVIVSLFTVSWATALGEVWRGGGNSQFARLVSLAYPAGDVALLTVVVIVLAYAHAGSRSGLTCLGSGLALFAVADSGFAYLTAHGSYQTGNLIDVCWVAGFVVMAWAAVLDRSNSSERRLRSRHATVILPCLPSLIGVGFAVWRLGPAGADSLLLGAAGVMVVVLLVRQVVVVSDNFELIEQMRYQAFHDPLTGLSNRALFNDRLGHALELHRRDHRSVAVLLIDLDNFKLVNDTLGHTVGDELLIQVARRLDGAVRTGDTVARLGGDEFAILVEDSGSADEIAERVIADLGVPMPVGERQVAAGASIGIAALDAFDPAVSATEMLQQADIAMYAAKRAGKGFARAYSPEMARLASGHLDMQAALLADLAAARIDVAYQPIYLADGRLQGVEALARWTYRGATVSPEIFLAMARELGCINVLDETVLRVAARTIAPLGAAMLAVNVDRRTLAQPGFVMNVVAVLDEVGLPAGRLSVEVLEFDFVERDRGALESLRALREIGVMVAVDDFGAGYATLARLRALQPDVLKIDRSLVAGSEDPGMASLLAGAAQLGRHIGASIIAEGVETAAQYRAAIDAGCDALQGYYLSRPVDAATLLQIIAAGPLRPDRGFVVNAG
jgi:diguanylate cyclase